MVDIGEKRGVLVECSREMYRRLALSAQENRRSLGNEAGGAPSTGAYVHGGD